ncbi:MAG: CHAT domain-containing tetratricopeptide repeat protein [Ferruginibacter sp.]
MAYHLNFYVCKKKIVLSAAGAIFLFSGIAQCPAKPQFEKSITSIKNSTTLTESKKLQCFYDLKKQADNCNMEKDSIYAMLLEKIGYYEYSANRNYGNSIAFTLESVKINSLPQKNTSKITTVETYFSLALYYLDILQYTKSSACLDSVITIAEKLHDGTGAIVESKLWKAYLYFLSGDYQKCIEESTKGIVYALAKKDTANYVQLLVQRSQSYFFQNKLQESLSDIDVIFNSTKKPYQLAAALKTKAFVYEKRKSYRLAREYFKRSLNLRIKSNNSQQIALDYNDIGNFYANTSMNVSEAKKNYDKAVAYARKDNNFSKLALTYTNFGNLYLRDHQYNKAISYYLKTFSTLKVFSSENILDNPTAAILNSIGNTDLITDLLSNKVLLLLTLFKETQDHKYISASIKTALVTDSVISLKRHQQLGEQSKLYWRDHSRAFFSNAVEACYIANDARHAFYFMEKSRSVLLNDKLNELGASAHLSDADAAKEQELKLKLYNEQEKLNQLSVNTAPYNRQQQISWKIQQELEDFIKSLETKYPAYYSYKYSDKVPALAELQKQLGTNKASFVHYFTNDTIAYTLCITANSAKIKKVRKDNFNYDLINQFLKYCSDKDVLNNRMNYKSFISVSNKLYKMLFEPLHVPAGRVVICSDDFLIPFDALYSDGEGKNFLINNYIFSYAYSATSLLKQFTSYRSKGNFVGFAPVNFEQALHLNPLLNSATALFKSANNYSRTLLFTNKEATKDNFIKHIGNYTVANVFSHASADSTQNEPLLYMQDGSINLSELQLLNKPATQLVELSACQTNVGKNASGEGIYSLARGFASAGIPSVSATLWKADEDMIYKVSAKFNEYLAGGMSKDMALHQAKLDYLKNNEGSDKLMPYYWANMILIGNTTPLALTRGISWWWIAGSFVAVIFLSVIIIKWKRRYPRKTISESGASINPLEYKPVF